MTKIKTAWIRDAGFPVGSPAPGHFNCHCGKSIPCPIYGQDQNVICECGQEYTGHGWLVERRDEG